MTAPPASAPPTGQGPSTSKTVTAVTIDLLLWVARANARATHTGSCLLEQACAHAEVVQFGADRRLAGERRCVAPVQRIPAQALCQHERAHGHPAKCRAASDGMYKSARLLALRLVFVP